MLGRAEVAAYEFRARVGALREDAPTDPGQHVRNLGATIKAELDDLPESDVKAAIEDTISGELHPGCDESAVETRAHARLLAVYEWSYDKFGTSWEAFKVAAYFAGVFLFQFALGVALSIASYWMLTAMENFFRGFQRGYDGPSLGDILSGDVDVDGSSSRFRVDEVSGESITEEQRRLARQSSNAYQLGEEDIELIGRYEDVYIGTEGIGPIDIPDTSSPDPDTETEWTTGTLNRWFREQHPTDAEIHEREMEELYDDLDDFEEFHN